MQHLISVHVISPLLTSVKWEMEYFSSGTRSLTRVKFFNGDGVALCFEFSTGPIDSTRRQHLLTQILECLSTQKRLLTQMCFLTLMLIGPEVLNDPEVHNDPDWPCHFIP